MLCGGAVKKKKKGRKEENWPLKQTLEFWEMSTHYYDLDKFQMYKDCSEEMDSDIKIVFLKILWG